MLPLAHIAITKVAIDVALHRRHKKFICFDGATLRCPREIHNVSLNTVKLPDLVQENSQQHFLRNQSPIDLRNNVPPPAHKEIWLTMVELKTLKVFFVGVERHIIGRPEMIQNNLTTTLPGSKTLAAKHAVLRV